MGHLEVMLMAGKISFLGLLCRVGDGGWVSMVTMSLD